MTNSPKELEELVRAELQKCRARKPIPDRDQLSPIDEQKCRLLGGHLITWIKEWSAPMLQERAVVGRSAGWHRAPLICILSDEPGCVAARQIIKDQKGIVWGLNDEFAFLGREDPGYKYHITLETFFDGPPSDADLKAVAERYSLGEGEIYLWHTDVSTMGELFVRGGRHLLKWDGEEIEILEEAFDEWVS